MLDKLITLIVIDTNFILACVIWVMNGYYASIPKDLEDAWEDRRMYMVWGIP